MSTIPRPSRSKSRSPKRSSASPRARRPLHQRSDSETNATALQPVREYQDVQSFATSPFPKLQSQILLPQNDENYIYEDKNADISTSPIIPPNSPQYSSKSSASAPSQSSSPRRGRKGKSRNIVAEGGSIFTYNPEIGPVHFPAPTTPNRPPSRVQYLRQRFEGLPEQQESSPVSPTRTLSQSRYRPVSRLYGSVSSNADHTSFSRPVSSAIPPQLEEAYESPEYLLKESISRVNVNTDQAEAHLPKSINPISQLLESSLPRSPTDAPAAIESSKPLSTPSSVQARPRSSSAPSSISTDAMIEALVASGTTIQYAQLKKPSVYSLRSDTSSIKAAYPKPLAIRATRAAATRGNSGTIRSVTSQAVVTFKDEGKTHERRAASVASKSTAVTSDGSEILHPQPRNANAVPYFGGWADELDDVVYELHQRPLRHQYSFSVDSRPSSQCSSRGSFYNWLNDSYTGWARAYYRGDGRLRSTTPPRVTTLGMPITPQHSFMVDFQSSSADSPSEDGLPDAIYIPRSRPLQRDSQSGTRATAQEADINEQVVGRKTVPTRTRRPQTPLNLVADWVDSFVPRVTPRLSPDKAITQRLKNWQAPSIEEDQGWFGRVNRQIFLFCLGFVFPFAWFIAAALPIPARPNMMRRPSEDIEALPKEGLSNDLFESAEVRRYQKARWWRTLNRYFIITGVCVIAAIVSFGFDGDTL